MTRRRKIVLAIVFILYLVCVWLGAYFLYPDFFLITGLVLTACGVTILIVYTLVSRLSQASKPPAAAPAEQPSPRAAADPAGGRDWPELKAVLGGGKQRLGRS